MVNVVVRVPAAKGEKAMEIVQEALAAIELLQVSAEMVKSDALNPIGSRGGEKGLRRLPGTRRRGEEKRKAEKWKRSRSKAASGRTNERGLMRNSLGGRGRISDVFVKEENRKRR
jgi:hypothetical protein